MGDRSPKSLVKLGDVVLISTGEGVFTGREPHTSHELHQPFQLDNYRSDTERGMLVKPSVPPFKPECLRATVHSSTGSCRFDSL